MKNLSYEIEKLREKIIISGERRKILFIGLNVILTLVAFVMSIANIFTEQYILMVSTLLFTALCVFNILLLRTKFSEKYVYISFAVEGMILLAFFTISGIPEGFSVLWICLVPSFALLIFGRKSGSFFCIMVFVMMVFLFWVPFGKNLLQYSYSETFMLRFPFLYGAMYMISFFVEYVRSETEKQRIQAEHRYRFLYRHDALTGLYNRYGFNEILNQMLDSKEQKYAALILLDIDDFKIINDRYGHDVGDEVLKNIASLPKKILCEHCRFCRWGGEEFMILMQCDHNPMEMAEKVRKFVENTPTSYNGTPIKATVSVGVCIARNLREVSALQLIHHVDQCLYKSKRDGKNKVTSVTLG